MGVTIGPADWWARSAEAIRPLAIACPVGTTLPDGSRIICKAGGTAWIIAPSCTQVCAPWNGVPIYGGYTQVGNKCCVCEWSSLNTQLINSGFNPSDWFVPSYAQMLSPGYSCRTQWDTYTVATYWTSTEIDGACAYNLSMSSGAFDTGSYNQLKCGNGGAVKCHNVRAMRCVTY